MQSERGIMKTSLNRALFFLLCVLCAVLALPLMAQTRDVSVVFVGDVKLSDLPGKRIAQGHNPFAPFAPVLNASDIRIANLECVISTLGKAEDKPFTFRAHPRTLTLLKKHFDVVSLANNHTGDFGVAAFSQMLDLLQSSGLAYVGGGRDLRHAHQPVLFERHGVKIAILAYNEFFPRSFEANIDKPGSAWSDDDQVVYDIEQARKHWGADVVIPFMHWGVEDEFFATVRQQQLARRMVEAGADAVVGSHPHVAQNTEIYRGKPIVYSLGNFVFDTYSSLENTTGWALALKIDKTGVSGARIHEARIDNNGTPHPKRREPLLCWQRGESAMTDCR